MSRRSLRLSAAGRGAAEDAYAEGILRSSHSSTRKKTFADQSPKMIKQHKTATKQSDSVRTTSRRKLPGSSTFSHSSFSSRVTDGSFVSALLDESSIQEQTTVDHFWGLDDDSDLKAGGNTSAIRANGDLVTTESQVELSNGYTCNDCSMLSERKEALTTYSSPCTATSIIYSRDRSQKSKNRGLSFYASKILQSAKSASSSFSSFLVQLFQMILLRLGFDCKAHSNYCGSVNVKEFFREDSHLGMNGESFWKAAAGAFWWLGTGWYQLVTLFSLLNVFLLTRCLPKMFRLLLFLLPLFLLLGLYHFGPGNFLSLLPSLNWTRVPRTLRWEESSKGAETELHSGSTLQPPEATLKFSDADRVRELEKQMAFLSERWHRRDEEISKTLLLVQSFQEQVTQRNDRTEMLTLIKSIVGQHLKDAKSEETAPSEHNFLALHQEHEWRLVALEDLLAKLSKIAEGLQKEFELTKIKTTSDLDEQNLNLLSKVKHLELGLEQLKSELLSLHVLQSNCATVDTLHEKVDAQIKESVRIMLFGNEVGDLPESLLQWLASRFVSKADLQVWMRDLEMRILKNITLHMSVTNSKVTSQVVTSAVNEVGIVGITEAQAQIIVNNALKLYSQDKTGMVDFALESGGGSILSTRCSETYETKTALLSLFGIPLWYFSQSPRVVIQPDMYPGNCWAFKGSQGYLVVRLSMMIYPIAFSLEHIPKTLSPTGNINSAPKDFAVYGLENEYQEEGLLLGQYTYEQDGEPLQMFQILETVEKAFQIVELRIFSNWGHAEYTCLYRFRVHGRSAV